MSKKTLIIMRHAKTEIQGLGQKDFDRNLIPRGISDAKIMAERLAQRQIQPDLILASTANRTVQTAKIIAQTLKLADSQIIGKQDLYLCDAALIENILMKLPDQINTCMLIGHNPGVSEAIYRLHSGAIESDLPTAALLIFSFEAKQWKELLSTKLTIETYDYPKK